MRQRKEERKERREEGREEGWKGREGRARKKWRKEEEKQKAWKRERFVNKGISDDFQGSSCSHCMGMFWKKD